MAAPSSFGRLSRRSWSGSGANPIGSRRHPKCTGAGGERGGGGAAALKHRPRLPPQGGSLLAPHHPRSDLAHHRVADWHAGSALEIVQAGTHAANNLGKLLVGELRSPVCRSRLIFRAPPPPATGLILHILDRRPPTKMRGVAARRIVTAVQRVKVLGFLPSRQGKREPRSSVDVAADLQPAVSVAVSRSLPRPAGVSFTDAHRRPKRVPFGFPLCRHPRGILARVFRERISNLTHSRTVR